MQVIFNWLVRYIRHSTQEWWKTPHPFENDVENMKATFPSCDFLPNFSKR